MTELFSSADITLAKRIEEGHAHSGKSFALAQGESAAIEEIAGGIAVFTGLEAPSTQALNLGLSGPVSEEEFERLAEFYRARNSPLIIDLCTLAHPSLFELIQKTKHSVKEISFVVARKVTSADCEFIPPLDVTISPVHPEDRFEWASLLIEGFSGQQATAEQVAPMLTSLPGSRAFVGAFKGRRFSASVMGVMDNLATFFGDATVAAGRGHGLQLAHIKRNLSESAQLGCDLASSSVVPGGTSHRNYLRAGFQLVYPRIMFSVET